MEQIVNQVTLCGTAAALPALSHENHGRQFYRFPLEVERLSGAVDTLPILVASDLLGDGFTAGQTLLIGGSVRSFNRRTETGRRLVISVYADSLLVCEEAPINEVSVIGALCREPVFRRTPLGREICDVMLAVNRPYSRTDYLPCILWGRTARETAELPVGTRLSVTGRLQSRVYVKQIGDSRETRTAYEISALNAAPVPD